MAEEQDENEVKVQSAPKGGGKKKLIIAVAGIVVLLVAIGVPAVLFLWKSPEKTEEVNAEAAAEGEKLTAEGSSDEEELADGEEQPGAILPLDTFIVNLSGGKYVRVQIQIEFEEFDVPKKFYRKIVPVRDAIISLLTKKTQDELVSEKGRERLKEEIKETIDGNMHKAVVRRVYFTQFVIQ